MNQMEREARRLRGQIAEGRRCPLCGNTEMIEGDGQSPRFEAYDCPECDTHVEKNASPTEVLAHIYFPDGEEFTYRVNVEGDADFDNVVTDFWNTVNEKKRAYGKI